MKNLIILILSATIGACAPLQSKTSNSSITLGSVIMPFQLPIVAADLQKDLLHAYEASVLKQERFQIQAQEFHVIHPHRREVPLEGFLQHLAE